MPYLHLDDDEILEKNGTIKMEWNGMNGNGNRDGIKWNRI